MKNLFIIPSLFSFFSAISCHKEIKSETGAIDVYSNIYFGASKGLDKVQNYHISSINYSGDKILEVVPDNTFSGMNKEIYYIKDSSCYALGMGDNNIILSEISRKSKPLSLEKKKEGAIFSKELIPNYKNRKNLSDTVLFKKKYKRFEVNSPWTYTRFYIYPTDTIIPYSIYKHAEKDYNGRLERIDSYNKKQDIFVTLQLIPRKKWDSEAKEIFEFNQFVKNRKSE